MGSVVPVGAVRLGPGRAAGGFFSGGGWAFPWEGAAERGVYRDAAACSFSGGSTSVAAGRRLGLAGLAPPPVCRPLAAPPFSSGSRIRDLSLTLAADAIRPPVMTKTFASLWLKGAEAFGHEAADPAKPHSYLSVNVTAKAASMGENGGWSSKLLGLKGAVATKSPSSELTCLKGGITTWG